eukprot:g18314.t1
MSGASAVFLLDLKGKVIISRNYRGEVIDEESSQVKPVFCDDGVNFVWIRYSNLYLLATSQRNANALMLLSYLYKLADVLKDYFRELEEESIRDNFVITYELMDELMDNGYPQTTEVKILREYIKTKSHQMATATQVEVKPIAAITNAVSWRPEGIVHKKNEIFLDVVERLNLLVSVNGSVLRSEILGSLKMKSLGGTQKTSDGCR